MQGTRYFPQTKKQHNFHNNTNIDIFITEYAFFPLQIQEHRAHLVRCQGEETHGKALDVVGLAHTIYQTGAGIRGVKTCQGGPKDQAL